MENVDAFYMKNYPKKMTESIQWHFGQAMQQLLNLKVADICQKHKNKEVKSVILDT